MTERFEVNTTPIIWRAIFLALEKMAASGEYDPELVRFITSKALVAKIMSDDPQTFMGTMFGVG